MNSHDIFRGKSPLTVIGRPWRRRGVRIALLILLGVVIGGFCMQWFITYKMQAMMAGGGPKGGPQMSMPVEAAVVKVMTVDDSIAVPGTINAEKGAVLRPEVPGVVKSVSAAQGEEVKAGTVLIQLSDTSERADVAQAQASMRLAERNLNRLKSLRAEDAALVSQKDYDTALSTYEQAAATYMASANQLTKKAIKAPFAGVAGIVQVNPGDYVSVGQELVSLQTLKQLRVDFAVPERFSGVVEPGQEIGVRIAALNRTITATLVAADTLVDAATRNLPVRARIDNQDGSLRPGMFGDVTMSRGRVEGALMIPESALMPEGSKQFVYKFADEPAKPADPDRQGDKPAAPAGKIAQKTEVVTGLHLNGMVQVISGLTASDVVVSAGQMKIGPGSPIAAMNIGMASTSSATPRAVVSGTMAVSATGE